MDITINRWLEVPSIDPDDARRRKLLNILLVGVALIAVFGLAVAVAFSVTQDIVPEVVALYQATLATLIGLGLVFLINRYWSGQLASLLFLILLTIGVSFADEPEQVVNGRSLFLFTIPILMASVILRPWASFLMAGLSSLVITLIELLMLNRVPGVPSMLGFFAFALISWISARSLENALVDLRALNRELDQRVEDRTRDLAEALSRTEAILTGIADGVVVFDNDGISRVVNPAMNRILGKPPAEVVGRRIDALMADQVSDEDKEVVCDLVLHGSTTTPSVRFEWGDKTLLASFAPVRDNVGRETGTVAVFRDFTREAEVERMKSAFVSRISHELRTPLNAILGYADMIREQVYGAVTKGQHQALDRITINSRRQLSIVNDLLDQAHIEAGTLRLRITSFSPGDMIEEAVSVMEVLAQSKGLDLTAHVDDDVPSLVPGDRRRLSQILINLVGNAVKFTEEGGVDIHVYRPDPSHWAMAVSDTGVGIPQEAHEYIFEPFRQVDDSVTRKHSGSGLGLSIVKQLTELMGGQITLESEVGQGSTFNITLPLVPIQQEEDL